MLRILQASLLQLLLVGCWACASNDDGLAAFQRRDYATAIAQFSNAAKQGDSNALVNLAIIEDGGSCVIAENHEESVKLLQQAAEADNSTAKVVLMLGRMWGIGRSGPETSMTEFQRLLHESAEQGFPLAMLVLGQFYERMAAPPDQVKAYAWYGLAARRGINETTIVSINDEGARIANKLSPDERALGNKLIEQLDKQTPASKVIPLAGCSPRAGMTEQSQSSRQPSSASADHSPPPSTAQPRYTIKELGTLGGRSSEGAAINNSGQVVGYSETVAGILHPFLYSSNDGMLDLNALLPERSGWSLHASINSPLRISDDGQITGEGTNNGGARHTYILTPRRTIMDAGRLCPNSFCDSEPDVSAIGTLGGQRTQWTSIAEPGRVTGWSLTNTGTRAFLYMPQTGIKDLGTLGGRASRGHGVNKSAQVVGTAETADAYPVMHAFRYSEDTGMQDLNTLLPIGSGWELRTARGINDRGQITGSGIFKGQLRAYVLTPIRQ